MNRISFSALLVNLALVIGLKLENVTIPQYGVKDGSASLFCDFQLDSEEILLVSKWYKDGHEFFRYSPQNRPPILVFPVEGVYVNTTQSSLNHVLLKNITLGTGGTYKCEVSVEGSFRTLSQQGDMIIIAPPRNPPQITGVHPAVSVGDMVKANCTSFDSLPPTANHWYINEEKAEIGETTEYLPVSEPNGLATSVLGLHFQIESRHFKNGGLELKCTATIGNIYRVSKLTVAEANINAQPSIPGHNRLLSSGVASPRFRPVYLIFSMLSLLSPLITSFLLRI